MLEVTNNRKSDTKKAVKNDMVTVYGTGKSPFMEEGKAYEVHRILGETLVKKAVATAKAPGEKSSKSDK